MVTNKLCCSVHPIQFCVLCGIKICIYHARGYGNNISAPVLKEFQECRKNADQFYTGHKWMGADYLNEYSFD